MGVDSGLGTFRGKNAGVWPPLIDLKLDFVSVSNPKWFTKDPQFAWAFWQYRYSLYSTNKPHEGYTILNNIASQKKFGSFSYTSNIDGHWLATGLSEDRVLECHGSVHFLQCNDCDIVYPTPRDEVLNLKLLSPEKVESTPKCPTCHAISRPNVLMFGDWDYIATRYDQQNKGLRSWSEMVKNSKVVVIEVGAGTAVPTVRQKCEKVASSMSAPLIRINLEDPSLPENIKQGVCLPLGALEALQAIQKVLDTLE
eukprot:TRINITY_DN8102_c0_g2_i1.p1 TRINITY_DN8102_c0_g2~~TRINITY_DN8102_c0_g2_i1.p1  ORF type:complete len:285 (+),score=67.84 TRINITY_DN8102_c0_g2_i1:96-857(+)